MNLENNQNQNGHRLAGNKKGKKLPGKILAMIELIISAVFYFLLRSIGLIPGKYMIVIAVILLMLFGVCFGLQIPKQKGSMIAGIVLSVGFSLLFGMGSYYVSKTNSAMDKIGGATFKTDSMIVVVRKDDQAKKISDAKEYQFGCQTSIDQDNTKLMIEEVNQSIGQEAKMTEYQTVDGLAKALLDGEIDAAIYNEAFNSVIGEEIEDYESQIRILYQYGIHTEFEEEEKSVKEPFSVYISGIDVYGPISKTSRSDVNIIMTVNPKTKQILLTTTPRDYYLPIPGVSGGQKDKLTHAGIYGVDKSIATLEQLYEIEIDYYARVNFSSLIHIIDILGGVNVNSEYAFEAGGYSFQKGMNQLDGEAALAFSRERYSFSEGDNQRGRNQEAVITAILKKAMSPAILSKASSLIASVGDSVETNMTKDEMAELVNMQLAEGGSWNIVSVNAVGTGDSQPCYSSGSKPYYVMQPNMVSVSEIRTKMNQLLNGERVIQ